MRLYGRVMSHSLEDLGIEFHRYDANTMDINYWGQKKAD